jgi:ATP-dependent DNA helicase RecG
LPIDKKQITDPEVRLLLGKRESHFLDFKSRRISVASLTKSMSAFANADGGELFIGIEEDGSWSGFADIEAANGHIQGFEEFFPLGDYFDYVFLENATEHGLILGVDVRKTPDVRRASNQSIYIRRGAQNLKIIDAAALRRLELNKGIVSFEDETVRDEIRSITNSTEIIEFVLNIVPNAEPETWLRKQRLIRNELPTVSGEMLFADEPQIVLPKSNVKIYRYKSSGPEGTRDTLDFDPITVEGPAYDLIRSAVAKTIEITERIPVVGEVGFEAIRYPQEAIHEVITNAVIHRDYSIRDDIHVRIFDNRIEIQSPGRLPGHVTPANILQERFARNPTMVRLLNKFPNPPNKDVGEGLNTTFEVMRNLKLKDPTVEEQDAFVLVKLFHEKLGTYEEIIAKHFEENREINNRTAREICREGSENKIKRVFEKMIGAGLIERIPGRRGSATAYRKIYR